MFYLYTQYRHLSILFGCLVKLCEVVSQVLQPRVCLLAVALAGYCLRYAVESNCDNFRKSPSKKELPVGAVSCLVKCCWTC